MCLSQLLSRLEVYCFRFRMCVINVVIANTCFDSMSLCMLSLTDCNCYQELSMDFQLNTRAQRPEVYHFKFLANKQHAVKLMFIVQQECYKSSAGSAM